MDDIETILKATIQTKVVEAFNSTPEMVDKLVQAALSKEVNQQGGTPDYRDRDKMPYMDWLVGEEMRGAVRECVKDYIADHRDEILNRVKESISNADYGQSLAETVTSIVSEDWRWAVKLEIEKDQ